MGPLSLKQHREFMKLESEEARKNAAFTQEQQRKDELHQLKLQEAAAKASQGMAHKEEDHVVKLAEGSTKVPRVNRGKLGLPSMNPLADTGVLGRGQKRLPGMVPKGTDTVPAMLTPGEAVIPAPAAQDPKNKATIKRLVKEGRKKNKALGYADGTPSVPQYYNNGTVDADRAKQIASDRDMLANIGLNMLKLPAAAADILTLPQTYLANKVESTANALGVPRIGRALGIYDADVDSVKVPGSGSITSFSDRLNKTIDNQKPPASREARGAVTEVPPVPTTVNPDVTPQIAPANDIEAMDPYNLFRGAESGNKLRAKNPLSSAAGPVQFTKGTWESIRKQVPELAGIPYGSETFYSDDAQRLAFNYLNKQNEAILSSGNIPVNNVNRYVMHGLGASDGRSVLSNPEGNFRESLNNPDLVIKQNPVYARFKTNQDYIDWARNHLNRSAGIGRDSSLAGVPPMREVSANAEPQEVVGTGTVFDRELPPPIPNDTPPELKDANTAAWAREKADIISQFAKEAPSVSDDPEEQKSWLANAISSLYSKDGTGLLNDKELMRFALLSAGGMLTGGSVGGSLRYAARDTLSAADRRNVEESRALQQQRQFQQQEAMLDKRFEKADNVRREDIRRAEDKQLESEMIKEGRDAVDVRNWIKGGQKDEPPQIRTSYIRNGKSELMTVTSPLRLGGQVFKPGQPVWVYETVQHTGNRKGEMVQMARVGERDIPLDSLMGQGVFLDKWDNAKYGDMARMKRAQDFSDRVAKNIFEPIMAREFGASDIKGQPNKARQGLVTAGTAASQLESYFRGKVDLDDRATQAEVEKIGSIAAKQMASDIKSGTFKSAEDITPYLAVGEFRDRGQLSDKLVTLDKKSGKLMSADDILALRGAVQTAFPKSVPETEISRLATLWTSNPNNLQRRYENSDRMTGFALFVMDTTKQAQRKK